MWLCLGLLLIVFSKIPIYTQRLSRLCDVIGGTFQMKIDGNAMPILGKRELHPISKISGYQFLRELIFHSLANFPAKFITGKIYIERLRSHSVLYRTI